MKDCYKCNKKIDNKFQAFFHMFVIHGAEGPRYR